jgi:hypothetical protein
MERHPWIRARRLAGAALAALALSAVAAGCGDQGDVRAPLPESTQATAAEQMQTYGGPTSSQAEAVASGTSGSLALERALLQAEVRLYELRSNVSSCLSDPECAPEAGLVLRQLGEAADRERTELQAALDADGGDCMARGGAQLLKELDALVEAGTAVTVGDARAALEQARTADRRANEASANCAVFPGDAGRSVVAVERLWRTVVGKESACTTKACATRYLTQASKRAAKARPAMQKQLRSVKGCPRQVVKGYLAVLDGFRGSADQAARGKWQSAVVSLGYVDARGDALLRALLGCSDQWVDAWDVTKAAR